MHHIKQNKYWKEPHCTLKLEFCFVEKQLTYRNHSVLLHTNFTLDCGIICDPECIGYRWYFNDTSFEGRTFYINNVTLDYDYTKVGTFYCIGWNGCYLPQASQHHWINVVCMYSATCTIIFETLFIK